MKNKETVLGNMWYYFQGNFRYKLYYSKLKPLIRKHILEQIEVRVESMDRTCYNQGSCKVCGCKTTALQMCNKPCAGNCYPKMLSKRKWEKCKKDNFYLGKDCFFTLKPNSDNTNLIFKGL